MRPSKLLENERTQPHHTRAHIAPECRRTPTPRTQWTSRYWAWFRPRTRTSTWAQRRAATQWEMAMTETEDTMMTLKKKPLSRRRVRRPRLLPLLPLPRDGPHHHPQDIRRGVAQLDGGAGEVGNLHDRRRCPRVRVDALLEALGDERRRVLACAGVGGGVHARTRDSHRHYYSFQHTLTYTRTHTTGSSVLTSLPRRRSRVSSLP